MVSGVPRCGGHKRQHVGCPAGSAWEAGLGPGQPGEDMLFLHPAGSSLDEPSHPLLWSATMRWLGHLVVSKDLGAGGCGKLRKNQAFPRSCREGQAGPSCAHRGRKQAPHVCSPPPCHISPVLSADVQPRKPQALWDSYLQCYSILD